MLNDFRERIKLRRLKCQLDREHKRDATAVAKARASGANLKAIHELQERQHFENRILDDEISQLESRLLCKEANRFRVPLPDHTDQELWEESTIIGGWALTIKGFARLRSDIRQEQVERRKEKNARWEYWELRTKVVVTVATALTGLLGALIGWAAIWK